MPLTLYEIDVLHYTSTRNDKEYFVDALILKALDFEGEKMFAISDKPKLLGLQKEILEKMYLEMFNNDLTLDHVVHWYRKWDRDARVKLQREGKRYSRTRSKSWFAMKFLMVSERMHLLKFLFRRDFKMQWPRL